MTDSATALDPARRHLRAMDVVERYTLFCAASNRIPYWWATSPSITALQLKMLAEVSREYGVEFQQNLVRPIVASIGGGALNLFFSRNPIMMALKAWVVTVPVVGIPLRFGSGFVLIATYTYVLGSAFVRHYDEGGSYQDFTAAMFRAEASRLLGSWWKPRRSMAPLTSAQVSKYGFA